MPVKCEFHAYEIFIALQWNLDFLLVRDLPIGKKDNNNPHFRLQLDGLFTGKAQPDV